MGKEPCPFNCYIYLLCGIFYGEHFIFVVKKKIFLNFIFNLKFYNHSHIISLNNLLLIYVYIRFVCMYYFSNSILWPLAKFIQVPKANS